MLSRPSLAFALAVGATVLVLGPPLGSSAAMRNVASSQAFAVKIVIPNQSGALSGYVAAPKDSSVFGAGFAFPGDASVVTTGAITSTASADSSDGTRSASAAATEVTELSLFGGEVTVQRVAARVTASAGSVSAGAGDFSGTSVTGIGGSAVVGNQLGNWGTLTVGAGNGQPTDTAAAHGWHGSVVALDIRLVSDHGGLPAGSEIMIGYAAANVQAAASSPAAPATLPAGWNHGISSLRSKPAQAPEPRSGLPRLPLDRIPTVQPNLTAGRYVFPVYGDAFYSDTFGAPRADVVWHHGDDIFAQLGAPVLAVADGTIFSVGWNRIGGWRLWLRDRAGNQFYYAHVSAYSPFAVDNTQVRAGTVIGFVGNTGDAEGTPYHLHFEVHPVGLLPLGYDGAVDPTPYLDAWRRLRDIRFSAAGAWVPGTAHGPGASAPEPGAILIQMSDISSASGLDPGSLQRALAPVGHEGDGALVGGFAQPTGPRIADLGRG